MKQTSSISRRAYQTVSTAYSWEEIFEAGPYYERISELLEDAQHYAIFVGWQIDSRLPLRRPYRPERGSTDADALEIEPLREKILRIVESKPDFHFYFLMWDHAYFYVLEREAWQGRIWEDLHPRVHFVFDNRHPFGGSHHEKICVIDGTIAFCGGIDLCDERWDTPQHLYWDPRRSLNWRSEHHGPYHDVAVQVTGPVAQVVQDHIRNRWKAISSIPFPKPLSIGASRRRNGGHLVYVSRTFAEIEVLSRGSIVREIEFLFRDLIQTARQRIVLEGQYYWSPEINDMLIAKAHEMAGKDFEIILILTDLSSLKALTNQLSLFELKLLEKLETAARISGTKLTVGFPHVHPSHSRNESRSKPIYIHSKVMIIDDRFISIGSANLASRALRLDTEVSLTFEARTEAERSHIRRLSEKILKHWNLVPGYASHKDVHLHLVQASEQARCVDLRSSFFARLFRDRIPWKFFFDPQVPWFHPLERRFRKLSNSRFPWPALITAGLWVFSTLASLAIASAFGPHEPSLWEILYAVVLTSVWFVPIPFTLIAILSSFQLGFEKGVTLSVSSLWIAGLLGYWLTREFPSFLTRYYRASGPSWLPKRLMLREFPAVVSVSLDPRVMLRSKIAYQGLYCVPIPWFAMNMLLVLPSSLYFLLLVVHQTVPDSTALFIRAAAARVLIVLAAFSVLRLTVGLLRKGRFVEKKAS